VQSIARKSAKKVKLMKLKTRTRTVYAKNAVAINTRILFKCGNLKAGLDIQNKYVDHEGIRQGNKQQNKARDMCDVSDSFRS